MYLSLFLSERLSINMETCTNHLLVIQREQSTFENQIHKNKTPSKWNSSIWRTQFINVSMFVIVQLRQTIHPIHIESNPIYLIAYQTK